MQAALLTPTGFVGARLPIPTLKAGQVLVQSLSCGICEGEVFQYRQRGSLQQPRLLGHEGSGIVQQVASDVTRWKAGDVVTTALGGSYAEFFAVDADLLVALPPPIDPRWAVGEAVACCAYSAQNAHILPGDRVAIIGCGFMGLLIAALAKHQYQAGQVSAVEPLPWRRQLALDFGADSAAATAAPLDQNSFDVVIEAAGVAAALDSPTLLVKEHGRLTLVGYHQSGGGLRTVNMQQWNYKALEITSGHCRRPLLKKQALEAALPLLATGGINLKGLVTPYPLGDINTAAEDFIHRKEGLIKGAVVF